MGSQGWHSWTHEPQKNLKAGCWSVTGTLFLPPKVFLELSVLSQCEQMKLTLPQNNNLTDALFIWLRVVLGSVGRVVWYSRACHTVVPTECLQRKLIAEKHGGAHREAPHSIHSDASEKHLCQSKLFPLRWCCPPRPLVQTKTQRPVQTKTTGMVQSCPCPGPCYSWWHFFSWTPLFMH